MTRIEGHPPAANYGPTIRLPQRFAEHWGIAEDWTTCPTCDTSETGDCPAHCDECDQAPRGLCVHHAHEGQEDGAIEIERGRREAND